jgi:hypothetical protein
MRAIVVSELDEPEAMLAGPSEPAHAGVMTAVVAAMTTTGAASRLASDRPWLRSLTGRASSPGPAAPGGPGPRRQ